jgi:hypothetical protein
MPHPGLVALVGRLPTRFVQTHRGTRLALAIGMMGVLALLTWSTASLFVWLRGQTQMLSEAAPGAARSVIAQVEHAAPGAREKLGDIVPALMQAQYLPQIQQKAATLDAGQVMAMIRGQQGGVA